LRILFRLAHFIIMSYFVITGNGIYDQILSGIIAVIGYIYAFMFTKGMSYGLGYNSILMSFTHWTARTIVSIMMIVITRRLYEIFKSTMVASNDKTSNVVAVAICVILWVFVAEVVKTMTGLRKNYF
jgi:hypothetical protein